MALEEKETLDIDNYIAKLLSLKNIHEQKGAMQKICSMIESLPLSEQQACMQQLKSSIRKDFEEISLELEKI